MPLNGSAEPDGSVRVAVYTDYAYRREQDGIWAERAFARFLGEVGRSLGRLTVIGRLAPPDPERARYRLADEIRFAPLPYYRTLTRPLQALSTAGAAARAFWRAIADVDRVWLLGPSPFALLFALLAVARRKPVVLGVRQDTCAYLRARHPGRPILVALGGLLDLAFRALARFTPVVAVGPGIAERYRSARAVHELAVSLVGEGDLVDPEAATARTWGEPARVLSVGRLESEKNPLLLASVLGLLDERTPGRWRLVVCGEGPLAGELERQLAELSVAPSAELAGYVPLDGGLRELYRSSDALLHVSWTEGLPQVLVEAFAAGTPVVATDVGGIRAAVGDAALLVPPGDARAAADALTELAENAELRRRLVRAGLEYARRHTIEAEATAVARFIGRPR